MLPVHGPSFEEQWNKTEWSIAKAKIVPLPFTGLLIWSNQLRGNLFNIFLSLSFLICSMGVL